MDTSNLEITLEALKKDFKNLDDIIMRKSILYNNNQAYLSDALNNNEFFIKTFGNFSDHMNKLVKSAQSSTFSDKITKWTCLFDEKLEFINAHRSELLSKKDVKNYTYKRHIWRYEYREDIREAIFSTMNNCIATVNFAINALRDGYTHEEVDNVISDYYRTRIDSCINTFLYGTKKGELDKRIKGLLLGDGFKEVIITMNFQNEVSISTLIDLANKTAGNDWKYIAEKEAADVKDIEIQIKDILKRLNIELKKSNPKDAKYITKHLKTCSIYLGILVMKIKEFQESNLYCFKTFVTEVSDILKGLYEYDGD